MTHPLKGRKQTPESIANRVRSRFNGNTHTPNEVRFWRHVKTSDGCWIWTGTKSKKGYGSFCVRISGGKFKNVGAHRFAYELLIGLIPQGMELDHIKCENPSCVNPWHVELKTKEEHALRGNCLGAVNARKTECVRGHKFTPENTLIIRVEGKFRGRQCRACNRMRKGREI